MAILEIKDAKKALENAPEGAEYWTPGYNVEYRKIDKHCIYGWFKGEWTKPHDAKISQERIDKGWWIPELRKMVDEAESVDGVEVTAVAAQSDEEFGLPFVVDDSEEEPIMVQQLGRAIRMIEPKHGEWWSGTDSDNDRCVRVLLDGVWYDYASKKAIQDDFTPTSRMFTSEEFFAATFNESEMEKLESFANERLHVSGSIIEWAMKYIEELENEGRDLAKGFAMIHKACKERGLGDRPFVDIINLLEKAENPLVTTYQDHVYPIVDGAWYMCEWKRNDGKRIVTPVLWKFGGFYSESEALSQTDNDIKVLYRMAEAKPQEMVTLQLDSLPSIGSIVYIKPNRDPGDGQPGFKSDNAERKVKIHSHFTDDRGIDFAAYVSCDDKHPIVGGVAVATAFENEFEKAEREKYHKIKEWQIELTGCDIPSLACYLVDSGIEIPTGDK